MTLPGQRGAQPAQRAAIAVQRALGRAANGAGLLCEEIGITDADTGERMVLSLEEGTGREMWTDETTGAVCLAHADDDEDEDEEVHG